MNNIYRNILNINRSVGTVWNSDSTDFRFPNKTSSDREMTTVAAETELQHASYVINKHGAETNIRVWC